MLLKREPLGTVGQAQGGSTGQPGFGYQRGHSGKFWLVLGDGLPPVLRELAAGQQGWEVVGSLKESIRGELPGIVHFYSSNVLPSPHLDQRLELHFRVDAGLFHGSHGL